MDICGIFYPNTKRIHILLSSTWIERWFCPSPVAARRGSSPESFLTSTVELILVAGMWASQPRDHKCWRAGLATCDDMRESPLLPSNSPTAGRRAGQEVIRARELLCPSPASALRRAGPAHQLGSKVELTLDVGVTGALGPRARAWERQPYLLSAVQQPGEGDSPSPPLCPHHLWRVIELAMLGS